MNQKQDNMTTMFETTLVVLDKNGVLWNDMPAFADAVTRAKQGTAQIRSKSGEQQSPTEGITGEKGQARDDLEEKLIVVADSIAAFAAKTTNHDLAAKVELTRTSLDRMPDSDLVQAANRVLQALDANLAALAPYNITAETRTAFDGIITAYANKKESPREAVIGRKVATLSLSETIRTVRSIFRNEIDKMMTMFRRENPDFYNGYFAARIIIDRAATIPKKEEPPPPKP